MTLIGVTALTLRYFNEFAKPAIQLDNRFLEHRTYWSKVAFCNTSISDAVRNVAVSYPDELLVLFCRFVLFMVAFVLSLGYFFSQNRQLGVVTCQQGVVAVVVDMPSEKFCFISWRIAGILIGLLRFSVWTVTVSVH